MKRTVCCCLLLTLALTALAGCGRGTADVFPEITADPSASPAVVTPAAENGTVNDRDGILGEANQTGRGAAATATPGTAAGVLPEASASASPNATAKTNG